MANQAIALQARAPQGNFLAPAIQQGAQMINMMRQQQALDRQTAVAQQQMEIARAGETRAAAGEDRAAAEFKLDQDAKIYAKHRQYAPAVIQGGAGVYQQWLDGVAQDNPQAARMFANAMPVENFDKDAFTRMVGTMDQNFEARYGKAITKELITPEGAVMGANISGLPGATYAVPVPDISRPLAPAAPAAGVQPMAAPQAPAPAAGGMFRPISAPGGQPQGADPQAALLASLTEAYRTKQISADVVEQLYQMAGPQSTAAVDQFLQANRIQVAGGGMRSAVYRPEGNAMEAQQVQYDPNAYAPVRAKSPMQSPAPGIYAVPVPQIAGVAGAETEGRENVRVGTQPRIVAGEERVKRLEKLRGEQPRALADARSIIADMDSRILAIDEFLRNPDRNKIVGVIEGRIPDIIMDESRSDVKGLYDAIVSNQVLNELIKGRQQTETGASPMGIVSDRDLAVAAAASNRLRRTGSEKAQDVEMQRLRDILYRTRQLAIKSYGEVYREVAKDAPDLRLDVADIPSRYKARPQSSPATQTATTKAPPGVPAEDWKYMSPEDRALWPK